MPSSSYSPVVGCPISSMADVRSSNLRSRVPERSGVDCADIFFGLRLRRRRRRQSARIQLSQGSLNSFPGRDSNPSSSGIRSTRNPQGTTEAENSSASSRHNEYVVGIDENRSSLSILSEENASVLSNGVEEEADGGGTGVSRPVEITSGGRLLLEACDERSLSEWGNEECATIAEILKCFICLGKVVDAQLCPCCSKLVCSPCIQHWLMEQKSQCPHCRMPLLVSQLINCKFISEIIKELDKMCGKAITRHSDKICLIHDSPFSYFCLTCSSPVCSDCAVLDEDHHNHSFERLISAYSRHKKKINQEALSLRQHLQELSSLVKAIDENIESVLKAKDASLEELQKSYERIQKSLEEQLKCKLSTLLAQKGSITHDMELVETVLHELDNRLTKLSKTDLIAQEPMICNMLQDIRNRTLTEGQPIPVSTEFISEM